MKIYLIGPYGPIPNEPWADYRFLTLGKKLSAEKKKVVWITSSFSHHSKRQRNLQNNTIKVNDYFHIKIIKTPSYNKNFGIKRLWFEFMFGLSASFFLFTRKDIKLTITAGTNFTIHPFISLVSLCKNKPYAIDVLDLYPELIVRNINFVFRWIINLILLPIYALRKLEILGAKRMIYCSNDYRDFLANDSEEKNKVVYIGTSIYKNELKKFDLPHKEREETWITYAGSLGETYDINVLIEAIKSFSTNHKVRFFIAGKGPYEEKFKKLAQENLHFLGNLLPSELLYLYSRSDLLLATYSNKSTVSIPLKAFDSISQNLPIITSLQKGDLSDLIRNEKIGFFYQGGDIESLNKTINNLIRDKNLILRAKENINRIRMKYSVENQYDVYFKHIVNILD
tara:strand:- start:596 stop:1786 length:1191 start_codon:yes stop_codon:yes gene_type:complete